MAFDDLEWISDTVFHLGDRVWAQGREAAPFCVLTLPPWKLISLLKIYGLCMLQRAGHRRAPAEARPILDRLLGLKFSGQVSAGNKMSDASEAILSLQPSRRQVSLIVDPRADSSDSPAILRLRIRREVL